MGFTSFNPSYGLGAQVRAILEDGRSGIAIGVGDRVVRCASRFLGVFLENLAAPLGRAQSPAVKIGEHFLGRGAESYTFDRADLGKTDQAQRQRLRLGGLLRFGPFPGLGGFLHGLWHRLTLSDSAKNSRVPAPAAGIGWRTTLGYPVLRGENPLRSGVQYWLDTCDYSLSPFLGCLQKFP